MTASPPVPAPTLIWKVYRIPDDSIIGIKRLPRRMRGWGGLAHWMASMDKQKLPRAKERILKSLYAQGHNTDHDSTELSERLGYDGANKWRVLWARLLDGAYCFPPPHVGISTGLLTGQFIDLTRVTVSATPTPGISKAPRACEICNRPLTEHPYCQGCGCLVGLNHLHDSTSPVTVLEHGGRELTLDLCQFCARMLTTTHWGFDEGAVLRLMGQLIRETLLAGQVEDPCFALHCRAVSLDPVIIYQGWCRKQGVANQPLVVSEVCRARVPGLSSLRSALDGSTDRPGAGVTSVVGQERRKVRV